MITEVISDHISDHGILIFRPCNTEKLKIISQVCLLNHFLVFFFAKIMDLVWECLTAKINH